MAKIRVGVIGIGNCFAGLYQGIEYYRQNAKSKVLGAMEKIGNYSIFDIEFTSAFDVGANKVNKPLHVAAYAEPNKVFWMDKAQMPESNVVVNESPILDGIGIYVENLIKPVKNKNLTKLRKETIQTVEDSKTEILINYLPVGSQKATEFWAEVALETNCGFINCMPVFIASNDKWESKFRKEGIPLIGDDIKGVIGATIVHRTLAQLCDNRNSLLDQTYQINVGGNSVTGDQELLLVVNGKLKRIKIGDFIDTYLDLYGKKRVDGKDIVIMAETNQDVQCYTIDDSYNAVLSKVDALIRHKISEPIYEITTQEGRKIKITGDHNVFTLDNYGNLQEIPVNMLKEDETFIAVPKSLPSPTHKELTEVDLTPYLSDFFAQGVENGYIRVHNHPEIRIPVKFPITDELLHIAGLWLADGNFDRTGSSNIELACGNEPECMQVVESFSDSLHINYTLRNDGIAVRLVSKTLGKIFRLALGLTGNTYTKSVPEWVFNLSPRQIALLLRGYLSGDGGVVGKQIRWTSVSEKLIRDIQTLFMLIGIDSTIFKERTSTKSGYKSSVEHFWHGIISSKHDIKSFVAKVGFLQIHKNRATLEAYERISKWDNHKIPNIPLIKKWKIKSKSWHKTPSLRAYTILSQLEKVGNEYEKEKITNICAGDARFLKIKKIRQINSDSIYVYDISTKPFERFICSNILVHNTDFTNMLERSRLESKKISKTEAVQNVLRRRIPDDKIYVGPSDFIPFLGNTKLAFIRLEGNMWANRKFTIELRLEVDDKANSAGIAADAIRTLKVGIDRKIGGSLTSASALFMKHPLRQMPDDAAKKMFEEFLASKIDR